MPSGSPFGRTSASSLARRGPAACRCTARATSAQASTWSSAPAGNDRNSLRRALAQLASGSNQMPRVSAQPCRFLARAVFSAIGVNCSRRVRTPAFAIRSAMNGPTERRIDPRSS